MTRDPEPGSSADKEARVPLPVPPQPQQFLAFVVRYIFLLHPSVGNLGDYGEINT
jgi:hypothetical protein